ncbi:MAG TPA: carbonic anhydrase [Bryobacteraceae bacterium]|jgi:carbonic anhydrase|nr:carbonic anhydrase [Bryobacteraceae bacterium]
MSSVGIEQSRSRLLTGLRKFQHQIYPERREAYERVIRDGQQPHALFITCADSRIDPELLTQSGPGDIFVSRNIGNLVPAYGEVLGGISAVIEYAALALEIDQVVVCGHTDCGAMRALLHPEKVSAMPTVKSWLRSAEAALSVVQARKTARDESEALHELIEENVLLQMRHLRTHPSIAGKLAQGSIALSGWVYDIAQGDVRIYDEQERRFISAGRLFDEVQGAGGAAR